MFQQSDYIHDSAAITRPGNPLASPAHTRTVQQRPAWVSDLKRFETPDSRKATMQIIDTALPYFMLLAGMYLTIHRGFPYWVTLLVALPASGLLARLFIFFHDCSHGSYLRSHRAMKVLGTILGILTFIPFSEWRALHAIHHSSSGNLDRRGIGDVWTMTVDEYLSSPWIIRLLYRAFRNPLIMFGLGPFYTFLIAYRLPSRGARREHIASVVFLDLMIAAILAGAALTIGLKTYIMIQLPVILIGGTAGIWLFYVQHQFDPSYWSRSENWQSFEAALQGSSYYKLPRMLQWFSGNIGFHHIHHLRPKIPNYNLERCLNDTPELQLQNPLTLWRSLKSVRLNLWDEKRRTLISFRELPSCQ
jgi:omega-6 fatty acid desaturase (delta-12 desaturase)